MAEVKDNSTEIKDNVVRLRGLPFSASKKDVENFFGEEFDIIKDGIFLPRNADGRASGQAYVQFGNMNDANKALEKNKQTMGHRYIEVYASSMEEKNRNSLKYEGHRSSHNSMPARNRPGPYGSGLLYPYGRGFGPNGPPRAQRNNNNGYRQFSMYDDISSLPFGRHNNGRQLDAGMNDPFLYNGVGNSSVSTGFQGYKIQMRGLPFQVSEDDIMLWFSSVVAAINVRLIYNNDGRPSGSAEALFANEMDAMKAMTKNKENLEHRYIELHYAGPVMSPINGNLRTNTGAIQMNNIERGVLTNGREGGMLSGSTADRALKANNPNLVPTGISGFGLQGGDMGGITSTYGNSYNMAWPY